MKLRGKIAIICAKIASKVIRIFTRGSGGTFPGYLAQLIEPDILSLLAGMVREKVFVTMGTNGKTTVNNLLCHVLADGGKRVIINRTGSNMQNGVVSAFVLGADWKGSLDADYACMEVDEFAALYILPKLRPDCVILTNIFRDQLDRYGEVDTVCDRISKTLDGVPGAKLVINCDDILSAGTAFHCINDVVTFGINESVFDDASSPKTHESIFCRLCGSRLEYQFFHYGQLGIYHCPGCGWKRPNPDYAAENIVVSENRYRFELNGEKICPETDSPYNIYNALSVYAALCAAGILAGGFAKAVEAFDFGNGREEVFRAGNAMIRLYLAKNPVGFQQKISMLLKDEKQKDIVIRINDTFQDGRDVSWLWDVDFGYLRNDGIASIMVAGSRRHDMALRLKYENIPYKLIKNIKNEIINLSQNGTGNIYVIVNYSGLKPTNRMLNKLQDIPENKRR